MGYNICSARTSPRVYVGLAGDAMHGRCEDGYRRCSSHPPQARSLPTPTTVANASLQVRLGP